MNRYFRLFFLFALVFSPIYPAFSGDTSEKVANYPGSLTMTVGELPKFEDFPADTPSFTPHPVDLSSHPDGKTYKTRLTEDSKGPPNFAGMYRIVSVGCGTDCQRNWIVNLKTGKILADVYTEVSSAGLLYTANSRMLIVNPPYDWKNTNVTDELNPQWITTFLVLDMDKQELEPIRQIRMDGLF